MTSHCSKNKNPKFWACTKGPDHPCPCLLQSHFLLSFSSIFSLFPSQPIFQLLQCTGFYLRAFACISQILISLPVRPFPSPLLHPPPPCLLMCILHFQPEMTASVRLSGNFTSTLNLVYSFLDLCASFQSIYNIYA